jgi:Sulfotransferase family
MTSSTECSLKPRVIYVMGAGKSGSTIFGVTLGNCVETVYTGELFSWLVRSGVPVFDREELRRFWRGVGANVDSEGLFGNEVTSALERSGSIFRVRMWPARRRLRTRYRRVMTNLYCAIARSGRADKIVDTSHFPLRARELRTIEGIEIYLVFLIRNPRNVVASYIRHVESGLLRRSLAALRTNADLWLTYALSTIVFLSHPRDRRVLVRHEEFVEDPEGILNDLLDRFSLSSPVPNLKCLRTGYPLLGNTLLRAETVALRSHPEPPPKGRPITALLQLPWAIVLPWLRPIASAAPSASTQVSPASGDGDEEKLAIGESTIT